TQQFHRCKTCLNKLAAFDPPCIYDRKKNDQCNGHELGRRNFQKAKVECNKVLAYGRNQVSKKFRKCNANGCDRSCLYHGEKTPTVEKSNKWIICFFEIDILPAGFRKHSAGFSVTNSSGNRHESSDHPYRNQPSCAADVAGNVGANNED